jgi:hypothetical protein
MNIPSSIPPSTTISRPSGPPPLLPPTISTSIAATSAASGAPAHLPAPSVSTKPSIPFSTTTATPIPTVSKAFNIGPLEAAVPP